MSKGGGDQQTTSTSSAAPWDQAQPFLRDLMNRSRDTSQTPNSYYGGPLTVGQTPAEINAWKSVNQYGNNVFGGQPTLQYGDAVRSLNGSMNGDNQLGQLAGQVAPKTGSVLDSGFAPQDINAQFNIQGPQGSVRDPQAVAGQIGNYGFGTTLDPNGKSPTFGVAGNLDARDAYQKMLSGTPDYAGTQGAIDAANAPIVRQFNNEILPGLNQKATFTNNETGGVKALNRVLPEIGDRMAQNAQTINNNERLRALSSQESAANQISNGGFQGYGLGLQTASGERGLEQSRANLGLNTDQTRAQLGLQDNQQGLNTDQARYGMSQGNANFSLANAQAKQNALSGYRSDALGYGSLAGNLASQSATDQARATALFPSIYDTGRNPGNDSLQYANYDRALQEDALTADQNRFNYMRDQPFNNLSWYSSLLNGTASPYASQTSTGTVPQGSRAAGVLGGAAAGSSIGKNIGSGYGGWGALLGGLLGGYG